MAGEPGFEPGLHGSEPSVLPLNYSPTRAHGPAHRELMEGARQCQARAAPARGKRKTVSMTANLERLQIIRSQLMEASIRFGQERRAARCHSQRIMASGKRRDALGNAQMPHRRPGALKPWPRSAPLPMPRRVYLGIAMRRAPNHGLRGRGQMALYSLKPL